MTTKGALGLVAAALALAAACAPAEGPPEITIDRTACDTCGMLVSEPRYAAAYRTPDAREARTFDDIGCLLKALGTEPHPEAAEVWVQDSMAGGWLDARTAWYVQGRKLPTPMGSGLVAVRNQRAADLLRQRTDDAEALDFRALVASAGSLAGHEPGHRHLHPARGKAGR